MSRQRRIGRKREEGKVDQEILEAVFRQLADAAKSTKEIHDDIFGRLSPDCKHRYGGQNHLPLCRINTDKGHTDIYCWNDNCPFLNRFGWEGADAS